MQSADHPERRLRPSLVGWLAARSPIFYGWWVILLAVMAIHPLGSTFVYGFSVLFNPIRQEMQWSTVAITFAFSLRSEVGAITSPAAGFLMDRYGPQKMLAAGLVIMGLGFWLLSFTGDLVLFYAAFVVLALGNSLCSPQIGIVAVSRWFRRRRSRAISFLTAGTGMGGLTAPIMEQAVRQVGWRAALQWFGLVGLMIGLPLTALMGDRPDKYGMALDGQRAPDPGQVSSAAGTIRADGSPGSRGPLLGTILRNRNYWLLAGAIALSGFANSAVLVLLVPALVQSGTSPAMAALILGALPIVSVPARLLLGSLGDFVDKRKLLASCYMLQAVGLIFLVAPGSALALALFLLLFGVGRGGPLPLQPALQADYFGANAIGSTQGMLSLGSSVSGFLGPLGLAWLADTTGQFGLGWVVLSICAAGAVPLALALRANYRATDSE